MLERLFLRIFQHEELKFHQVQEFHSSRKTKVIQDQDLWEAQWFKHHKNKASKLKATFRLVS